MDEMRLPHDHKERFLEKGSGMPDVKQFQTAADILKLLGDASRIRIFWILCHCETCVINLSAMVDMSSPAVSHHLRQLKAVGLVSTRRDGKEMYYTASKSEEADLLHHTIEQMIRISCPTTTEADEEQNRHPDLYRAAIADTIREVHALITENLEVRYTISELSARFLVNTSTLKEGFKAAYGMPIASYMKEYRIRYAEKLLRSTDRSVAEIAAQVGYETQSKFTKAFKDVAGMTPREYRKRRKVDEN